MIENFAKLISPELLQRSGTVFYSGREAFTGQSDIYLMGINPGGDPNFMDEPTIELEIEKSLARKENNFSSYRDSSWRGGLPGTCGIQPQILHLLRQLGRDPGKTPSSNLIFVRSSEYNDLGNQTKQLEDLCWPFHKAVIKQLKVRVIVCIGTPTKNAVRTRLEANILIDQFVRKTRNLHSEAYTNSDGIIVVGVTHPSRGVSWRSGHDDDPSPLVSRMLERCIVP